MIRDISGDWRTVVRYGSGRIRGESSISCTSRKCTKSSKATKRLATFRRCQPREPSYSPFMQNTLRNSPRPVYPPEPPDNILPVQQLRDIVQPWQCIRCERSQITSFVSVVYQSLCLVQMFVHRHLLTTASNTFAQSTTQGRAASTYLSQTQTAPASMRFLAALRRSHPSSTRISCNYGNA